MKIIKQSISLCDKCNNWKGTVEEKHNGLVLVHCACTLSSSQKNSTRSPNIICPNRDKLWWTPISEHIAEDGKWYHAAHFAGPTLNKKLIK
jgi:hypothetical protein